MFLSSCKSFSKYFFIYNTSHPNCEKTVQEIQRQKGLVYIPHPFERVRSGLQIEALDRIAKSVDIIEAYNGRAYFERKATNAKSWAEDNDVATAASSDAHGVIGWGRTYSIISQKPTAHNLVAQLTKSKQARGFVGLVGIIYPKFNRLRHKFTK